MFKFTCSPHSFGGRRVLLPLHHPCFPESLQLNKRNHPSTASVKLLGKIVALNLLNINYDKIPLRITFDEKIQHCLVHKCKHMCHK